MRDVAKHANVSVATVSHVVNDTHYVSPKLRRRVVDAIEALDYRPNRLARALSRKKVPLIALIVPDISNPYWSCVARAVQDVTDKYDYSVIVCSHDGVLEREIRFLRSLSDWSSGLIVHPYNVTYEDFSRYLETTVPAVIFGGFTTTEETSPNWDYVSGNNERGAQLAVEHLTQLGHRRIAFLQGPLGTPSGSKRLAGFRRALELEGLPVEEPLLIPGDYTKAAGRTGMATLLDMERPPTAAFCANDLIALGSLEVAQSRGYRVPQDLSIVGFDDIEDAAYASPPLTTIKQSPHQLGTLGAQTLMDRINGRTEPVDITIDFSLVIRESSAPPRSVHTVIGTVSIEGEGSNSAHI
jgi:LacI family transcriptional regulator